MCKQLNSLDLWTMRACSRSVPGRRIEDAKSSAHAFWTFIEVEELALQSLQLKRSLMDKPLADCRSFLLPRFTKP